MGTDTETRTELRKFSLFSFDATKKVKTREAARQGDNIKKLS